MPRLDFPDPTLLRACVSLFVQGWTYEKIGKQLGISIGVVHRLLTHRHYLGVDHALCPEASVALTQREAALDQELASVMPAALKGDCKAATRAIRAIKARCRLLGLWGSQTVRPGGARPSRVKANPTGGPGEKKPEEPIPFRLRAWWET